MSGSRSWIRTVDEGGVERLVNLSHVAAFEVDESPDERGLAPTLAVVMNVAGEPQLRHRIPFETNQQLRRAVEELSQLLEARAVSSRQ